MTGSQPRRRRRGLTYLAAIALGAGLAGLLGSWAYANFWSPAALALRAETRTHERPLDARRGDILERDAANALAYVQAPGAPLGDGVAYVSMPSFAPWTTVSLNLPAPSAVAYGVIARVSHDDGSDTLSPSAAHSFQAPRRDYLVLARRLDRLTDGWPGIGHGGQCYDGLVVAFQRTRAARVTSGVGDASCDRHYREVSEALDSFVAHFAPKPR